MPGGGLLHISSVTPNADRCAASAENLRASRRRRVERHGNHAGGGPEHVRVEAVDDASASALLGERPEHVALDGAVEQPLGRRRSHHAARKECRGRGALNRQVIGMVVATMRIERQRCTCGFTSWMTSRMAASTSSMSTFASARGSSCRCRSLRAESWKPSSTGSSMPSLLARHSQFLDAQRAEIVHRSYRGMRLPGLAVRGTHERDANPTLAEMRQDAAVKDLIVGMRQNDEQRRAAW